MQKKLDFWVFCRNLKRILFASILCVVSFFSIVWADTTTVSIVYDCGNGTPIGNQSWTQNESCTYVQTGHYWEFDTNVTNSVSGYCNAPSGGWTFVGWKCTYGSDGAYSYYQPGSQMFSRCYENVNTITCTAQWAPSNGSLIILDNGDCHGRFNNTPTAEIYGWMQNGVFMTYNQNGYSNQMTLSPLVANPVVVPNTNNFVAFYNISDGYLYGGTQMINLYGEITQNGIHEGSNNPGMNVWYADCLKIPGQGIIKLNSTDASLGGHGSEFVHQYNQNVYLYYNVNNTPQHTSQMTGNTNNITIPSRQGYIFAGYFSTQNGGTRYINENGYLTPAGQTVVGGYDDGSVYEWYAHWCPDDGSRLNPDGTCRGCADGESLNTLLDSGLFTQDGTLSVFGFDADGTAFGDEHHDYLNETPNTFGIWNLEEEKILLGSAMCSTDDGSSNPISSLNISQNPEENKTCWCSLTGGVINGVQYSLGLPKWRLITTDLENCEKDCVKACAGIGYGYPGGYGVFISELLEQEYCVPDSYNVKYYCSEESWENNEEPKYEDSVFYGATGYSFNVHNYILNELGCVPTGQEFETFKCVDDTLGNEVTDNDVSPWSITSNVSCFAIFKNSNFEIRLNKNGGNGGTDKVYTKYHTNVYKDFNRTLAMTSEQNNITVPSKTGYGFMGYYNSPSGSTQYIDADGYITQSGLTAGKNASNSSGYWYAKWSENRIGLTWDLDFPTVGNNGGENIGPSSCLIGAHEDNINAIHNVPQPQRSGYIFKGWRIVTDENDGGE